MRLVRFTGLKPKIPSEHLDAPGASVAVNMDFHDETMILPWPALSESGRLVTIDGQPFVGRPETIYCSDGVWIGFPEYTTTCIDHRRRAGEGSFLFVKDGKLWRSSAQWVIDGKGPEQVGIDFPHGPPQVAVSANGNPNYPKFPDATCGVQDPNGEDCNDLVPPEARTYVMTYVNCMGEESAPSPASFPVDVNIEDAVLLADPNTPPDNAVKRRYYRSAVSSKGTVSMLFVAEQPIDTPGFTDTVPALSLGDPVETVDHYPPPDCIEGVATIGDNLTLVWQARHLWVSEPMLPHAYSHRERRHVDFDIVRVLGVPTATGSPTEFDCYILTKGTPYHYSRPRGSVSGLNAERGDYGPWPFSIDEPCLTPFGVTWLEGGAAYVSPHGVIVLRGRGYESIMDSVVTEREWQDMDPKGTKLIAHHGLLLGFSDLRAWVFPVSTYIKSRNPNFSDMAFRPSAAFSSPEYGLNFAFPSVSDDSHALVAEWGVSEEYMTATWRSKNFVMPGWWEPAAMKIVGDFLPQPPLLQQARVELEAWERQNGKNAMDGFLRTHPQYASLEPALGSWSCPVTVRVYNEGRLYYERSVTSSRPFRLPHRRYGIEWAIEVVTRIPIREVHIDTSINDLVQLGLGVGNSV